MFLFERHAFLYRVPTVQELLVIGDVVGVVAVAFAIAVTVGMDESVLCDHCVYLGNHFMYT